MPQLGYFVCSLMSISWHFISLIGFLPSHHGGQESPADRGQSGDGSFLAWHSDTPCPQEATVFGRLARIS